MKKCLDREISEERMHAIVKIMFGKAQQENISREFLKFRLKKGPTNNLLISPNKMLNLRGSVNESKDFSVATPRRDSQSPGTNKVSSTEKNTHIGEGKNIHLRRNSLLALKLNQSEINSKMGSALSITSRSNLNDISRALSPRSNLGEISRPVTPISNGISRSTTAKSNIADLLKSGAKINPSLDGSMLTSGGSGFKPNRSYLSQGQLVSSSWHTSAPNSPRAMSPVNQRGDVEASGEITRRWPLSG